jgi:hypothetical protein
VRVLTGIATAALTMLVLYVALDAGFVPAAPGTSAALLGFAVLFGAGAWLFAAAGRGERSPMLGGFAAGLGAYALLRIVLF